MALNKGEFRLYRYDRMGGLVKLYNGNKGHDHDTIQEAEEQAKIYLKKRCKYVTSQCQILIIKYGANWNSKIIQILSKVKEDEIRQNKI